MQCSSIPATEKRQEANDSKRFVWIVCVWYYTSTPPPLVLVDSDCSTCNGKNSGPPKTLPKPTKSTNTNHTTIKHQHHAGQQQLDVKLDKEGYALPSKIKSLPMKTQLKENTGSGDSGIGECIFKGKVIRPNYIIILILIRYNVYKQEKEDNMVLITRVKKRQ